MTKSQDILEPQALTPPEGEETSGLLSMPDLSLSLEAIVHQVSPNGYEGAEQVPLAPNEILARKIERGYLPFFTESSPGHGYTYLANGAREVIITQNPVRLSSLESAGLVPAGVEMKVIPTLPSHRVSYEDVVDKMIEETAQVRSSKIATTQTRRLKRDAYTDKLTGVLNRRRYDEDRKKHLGFAIRDGGVVYVGFADVEAFTLFNGIYGHAIGDKVLDKFANALNFTVGLRLEDKCYRYGGDEFVPVVHAPKEGIRAVQERAVQSVSSVKIDNPLYLENPNAVDGEGKKIWQKGDEYLSVKMHLAFAKVDTSLFRAHVPIEKMRSLPDDFYNNWFERAREEAEKEAKKDSWRGREREYLALPSSATHRRSLLYKNITTQEMGREILDGKYVI